MEKPAWKMAVHPKSANEGQKEDSGVEPEHRAPCKAEVCHECQSDLRRQVQVAGKHTDAPVVSRRQWTGPEASAREHTAYS